MSKQIGNLFGVGRKFVVALLGMFSVPLCEVIGHNINTNACLALLGMASVYIAGESYVDGVKAKAQGNDTSPSVVSPTVTVTTNK